MILRMFLSCIIILATIYGQSTLSVNSDLTFEKWQKQLDSLLIAISEGTKGVIESSEFVGLPEDRQQLLHEVQQLKKEIITCQEALANLDSRKIASKFSEFLAIKEKINSTIRAMVDKEEKFFSEGIALYRQSQVYLARQKFEQSCVVHSDFSRSYYWLGVIAGKKQSYIRSNILFSKAIARQSNFWQAYYNRALNYQKQKKFTKAESDLQIAFSIHPQNFLISAKLGEVSLKLEKYTNAIMVLKESILLAPKYSKNYKNIAIAYYQLEDYHSSLQNYQKYLKWSPHDQDDILVIITKLNKLILAEAQQYYEQGLFYLHNQETKLALKFFQDAIAHNPGIAQGYFYCGKVCLLEQNYLEAIWYFEEALSLEPQSYEYCLYLGISFFHHQKLSSAEEYLRLAAGLQKRSDQAYFFLGRIFEQQQKIPQAIRMYQTAHQINSKNPLYLFQLAQLFDNISQFQNAKEHRQKARMLFFNKTR